MSIPILREENLRLPEKPFVEEGSVVVAVDIGNEFTKASYWNFEDGCSNIIRVGGSESIPTALAYRGNGVIEIGHAAIRHLQVAPKQVITHFVELIVSEFSNNEVLEAFKCREVSELIVDREVTPDSPFSWHIIANNESIKITLSKLMIDYIILLKEEIEKSLKKRISCLFVVVPEVTIFLTSFYTHVSETISIPIELISSSSSMCFSYGFFDDNVRKTMLLIDFGWSSIRLQVIKNENNHLKLGPTTHCKDLSGSSLSAEISTILLNQLPEEVRSAVASNYVYRNKVNLAIYQYLNKNKHIIETTKYEQRHRVNNRDYPISISSSCFVHIINRHIEKFSHQLLSFLQDSDCSFESFDDVLIAGGVANCRLVYEFVQKSFQNTYFPDLLTIYNPKNNANETIIVNGAAIQCASWMGVTVSDLQSLLFIDLLPHDICMKIDDRFEVVLPKGSSIPTRKTVEVKLDSEEQKFLSISLYRKKEEEMICLGDFDFTLNNVEIGKTTSVGMTFIIHENGRISASCSGSYEPDINIHNIAILLIALFVLTIAYFFFKIYFRDTRVQLGGNQPILFYSLFLTNKQTTLIASPPSSL